MSKIANPNQDLNQRIKASVFDAATFCFVFFIINLLLSFIVVKASSGYKNAYETVTTNIEYSNLCKLDNNDGYLTYETKELVEKDNEQLVLVNVLSYYYLNYISNSNLKDGYQGSKEPISHDIKWFNENILEIGTKDIFKTKSDSSDSLSTEIGVFNDSYILSNGQDSVYSFVSDKYNAAVDNFYNQDFIKKATTKMGIINSIILFVSSSIGVGIIYVLVPIINKKKQTFGKKIFKLVPIRDDELPSNLIMLLRAVPAFLVCVVITFINNAAWEIILPVGAVLVSSGFMIFTKKRLAIHDFVAGTRVILLDKYLELVEKKDGNK